MIASSYSPGVADREAGRDGADSVAAYQITLVFLAVLRGGTLILGVAETTGSSHLCHPAVGAIALAILALQSAATFGLAGERVRRRLAPALGGAAAAVETAAGIAGLLAVAYATVQTARATSTFWVEQYTVISAVVIAATAQRAWVGAAESVSLGATYLVSVLVWQPGAGELSTAARATSVANGLSYLPFFVVGAIGFAVLRSIIDQTDALRRLLGRLAAEQARVSAATSAYRIGHDIPKALLREVRRGRKPAEELRPWAAEYRHELLEALGGAVRGDVDLRSELVALVAAFAAGGTLRADLDGLGELPAAAPALLIAEATRELLNNASYHAYGFAVTLTAHASPTWVEVTVHDEGPGVDGATLAATWAGKQNTVHQFQAAGGSCRIDSSPERGGGTSVTLRWPGTPSGPGRNAPCAADAHAGTSEDVRPDRSSPTVS